jgi:O-antigen ligase
MSDFGHTPYSKLQDSVRVSLLGLPRFRWSLMLLGLCTFTFAIVTYRLPVGQLGIAVAVLGLLVQWRQLRMPFPLLLYAAFLLWVFVASFVSPYTDIALGQLMENFKLLVIMLVVISAIRTEGQLRFYLLFFLGCFVLFPVRGALVSFAVGHHPYGRAVWNYIYSNSNDLACLTMFTFVIAVGIIMSEPSRTLVRLGTQISLIPMLIVIVLTQSRGAALGLMVAIVPGLIPILVKRPLRIIASLAIVVLIVVFIVPESSWERLSGMVKLTDTSTVAESDLDGSAAERLEILKTGWQIFLDNPIFGVGLGAYELANAAYAPWLSDGGYKDTHNTYLNLAVETGLVGLVLWCALIVSTLRYARRSRRLAGAGRMATQQYWVERAFVGYLVAAIFGTYGALTFPYLILSVLWCSASILDRVEPTTANRIETKRL